LEGGNLNIGIPRNRGGKKGRPPLPEGEIGRRGVGKAGAEGNLLVMLKFQTSVGRGNTFFEEEGGKEGNLPKNNVGSEGSWRGGCSPGAPASEKRKEIAARNVEGNQGHPWGKEKGQVIL